METPKPGPLAHRLLDAGWSVEVLPSDASGKETLRLTADNALAIAQLLRDDPAFKLDMLLSAAGMDWKTHRETVYHFYSTTLLHYLVVKITSDAQDHSPSLMPVWHAADWHEREAYDLFGIVYNGHTDLRRILMPTYWLGHPMLKDYKEEDPRLVWNRR